MSRLNWSRCAHRDRPQESKYGIGAILDNGARTAVVPKDDLARRADRALQAWLRRLSPRERSKLTG
jgi:hypothetical protein